MKTTLAFRLALASTILLAPYCQAQDYMSMVKGLMGKGGGGFMGKATGLMGKNSGFLGKASGLLGKNSGLAGGVDPQAVHATIVTNLNTRQAQLESQIQAGATSGQLTPQEETELKSDLNRIADLQGQYLSGKLTGAQLESLLSEYNNITIKLQTYLTNQTVASGSTCTDDWFKKNSHGNQSGAPADQKRFQANVDTKQAVIDSSINEAVMAGTLNLDAATTLRNRLNAIAATESKLLADGSMSYSDAHTLISSLTELEIQVNAGIKAGQPHTEKNGGKHDADAGQSFLVHRIYRGIASNRLTEQEASTLMRDAHKIEDLEVKLHQSKGSMTLAQQRVMIGQINQLSNKITKQLDDKQAQ